MKNLFSLLLISISLTSCSNYYQALTASEPANSSSFNDFRDTNKVYILHNGSESFMMTEIAVVDDRKTVLCALVVVPFDHRLYINEGMNGKMKYRTAALSYDDESGVLNEIHLYLKPGTKTQLGRYTLNLENILKAEIMEKNIPKTKTSHAVGLAAGIGGAILLIGGIAAIIAASSVSIF